MGLTDVDHAFSLFVAVATSLRPFPHVGRTPSFWRQAITKGKVGTRLTPPVKKAITARMISPRIGRISLVIWLPPQNGLNPIFA